MLLKKPEDPDEEPPLSEAGSEAVAEPTGVTVWYDVTEVTEMIEVRVTTPPPALSEVTMNVVLGSTVVDSTLVDVEDGVAVVVSLVVVSRVVVAVDEVEGVDVVVEEVVEEVDLVDEVEEVVEEDLVLVEVELVVVEGVVTVEVGVVEVLVVVVGVEVSVSSSDEVGLDERVVAVVGDEPSAEFEVGTSTGEEVGS